MKGFRLRRSIESIRAIYILVKQMNPAHLHLLQIGGVLLRKMDGGICVLRKISDSLAEVGRYKNQRLENVICHFIFSSESA